ncbi:MAG: CotH kinase family protein, partial [Erysipelotrichaceae bacterium]|nr:CotH kinase family protein [Erysipelotrichaceae bacterium]
DDGYMVENDNYLEKYSVEEGGDPQFALEGLNSNATGYPSMYNLITVKEIGDNLLMKDGVIDKSPANQKAVAAEIQAWLQDAWDAIRSEDGYNSKGKHYSEYIDVESFACMYLMHEYVKSWDVCSGSLLFHRDGQSDSDKLIAGPMWDLDNTLGLNADDPNLGCMYSGRGAYITEINEYHKTSLLKTLGKHAEFMDVVKQQYAAHQTAFNELEGDIARMAGEIETSARMNHFKVNDLPEANQHSFSEETVLEEDTEYEQTMLATTDSKTDWGNYVANLKTYVAARSLWFEKNSDFLPCQHDQKTTVTAATLEENGSIVTRCTSCGTWSENKIIRSPKMFSVAAIGYNGSEREPAVTVKDTAGGTIAPSNYTVTYANNINVGEANATVTFTGEKYTGSKDLTFTIDKGDNPLKIKGKKVKVKRKALKKKAKKLAVTKVITFTAEGQGPMTYKKISGNKKLKINKTTGTVKVKKGLKKGTYKMKVKAKAAGNENYKASNWQKVTIKVKVK